MPTMDVSPSCDLNVPGVIPLTRGGFYLMSANGFVEAGPFPTVITAMNAAAWIIHTGRGVQPGPWLPRYSRQGLLVGVRHRAGPRQRARVAA